MPSRDLYVQKRTRQKWGVLGLLAAAVVLGSLAVSCGGDNADTADEIIIEIKDNLGASLLVVNGMSGDQVKGLMANPPPPWISLNLRKHEFGDKTRLTLILGGAGAGVLRDLSPSDRGVTESEFYAWIFFPIEEENLEPTWVTFESDTDEVINVTPLDCKTTMSHLKVGGRIDDVPTGSVCRPKVTGR